MSEAQGKLTIHTKQRGAELGDLFGIFFEDLNHAADGGLYAELVRNRSFEFDPIDHPDFHALTNWEKVERGGGQAELRIEDSQPMNERNRHYAVITIRMAGDGVGIANSGFNSGIPVRVGEDYRFSFYARRNESFSEPVRIAIESKAGVVHGETTVVVDSSEWRKYEAVISVDETNYSSRLTITTGGSGSLYVDMVSLFPLRTFLGRTNGLREDIATLLAELKPKFMRFPGGCLVHDGSLNPDDRNSMYRWKNTIGPVEQRPSRRNNWRYNQTLGLGYYEYFQFCQDIGAKPIPILPGGYDPHHKRIVPIDELGPWIDDALDLIEFANGDLSTEWGAIRAELGHPEPFGLEYIGIGNEEVGEPFFERYSYFHQAIKAKYPTMKIINSSGPFAAGGEYERGWQSARENGSDLVDEHYYQSPEWFLANFDRYDGFKADEPKVFLGEYASWGNTYYNALAEAAFMIGLERNAHAVGLACYAPMLCNVDYVNWKPDLIWFNNHEVFGTANYYVQKLFMHHQGDRLLRIEASGFEKPQGIEAKPINGAIELGTDASSVIYSNVRIVNNDSGEERTFTGWTAELSDTEKARLAGTAKQSAHLCVTDWTNYTLSMTAKRTDGPRGFVISFGCADDDNRLFWEISGWQNQDSMISSRVNGRNSCLTQSLFTVENDVTYELALEVSGRQIRSYINGKLIHDTEDKLPLIQPIYCSSSVDDNFGDTIVKVVNMQDVAVYADIAFEDLPEAGGRRVESYELSGHSLKDENSFEQPQKIVPVQRDFSFEGSSFLHEFPAHSVTVFRVKMPVV
ncbi:alpha-L-arabinofuranosidase C-terminal domain-containing protein [Paenibacillus sp. LHD-38]|uniref:alpha-L-arabinofuranosidase C-terminal domain-containing protein n=1 Tax=Paenibacillus sp. LHD-38 TaxID=3072143 RepID=UPI00280DB573|nr:alpha-L-arabinofuranosidase C-terminal domain-containing protein [Paenibacillus sp. LHD-38]MDQ8734564.1 alpha-L-arabinofuranosidase C-terminal domain-containing protein [Paenibacillus sp. LHD-38]